MNLGDIKKALLEGGVVGAGGAGFPTYAKLSDQAETIILNAAECEPLIKVDRQLLVEYTNEICAGMQMLTEAMGAKRALLQLKSPIPLLLKLLTVVSVSMTRYAYTFCRIFIQQVMKLSQFMK
jgi:Na+-translocating ferredoxin:NAD+ oxidoreductase RnfC subunit